MRNLLRPFMHEIGKDAGEFSLLTKACISVGLAMYAIVPSFIGVILTGTAVGVLINPAEQHEHNYYACACDEAPVLTEPQAITVGIAFFAVTAIVLYVITHLLTFSKWEQAGALAIFALVNFVVYYVAVAILHTQVTCLTETAFQLVL